MSNLVQQDAYEWFLWFKEECESEGIKDINKIPELIRRAKEQNIKYKELKKILKDLPQIKVNKFNEGYNQAMKDYGVAHDYAPKGKINSRQGLDKEVGSDRILSSNKKSTYVDKPTDTEIK